MILVIGSGVSSLAFAERCIQDGREFRIVERGPVGGKARTYISPCGNARFDLGGHYLHSPSENPTIAGAQFDMPIRTRKAQVLLDKNVLDYPIQQSIKTSGIELKPAPTWEGYPKNSMTEYFVEKFGDLAWKFFIPYNRKIWAVSTDLLETDHYEQLRNPTKGVGYNDKFMYADTGAHAVVDTIGKNVISSVEQATCVTRIDPVTKRVSVFSAEFGPSDIEYDIVVSPIPLPQVCKMVNGFHSLSEGLRWSSVVVFNVAYRGPMKFDGVSWLYVATHNHRFFRCGWYSNVGKDMAKPGYHSMYIEVSYPGNLDGFISVNDMRSEVLSDLVDIGILDNVSDVTSIDSIVIPQAYPLSMNMKAQRAEVARKALQSVGVYPVGRYGLHRWSGMFSDMKYASDLYDHLFNKGPEPNVFET